MPKVSSKSRAISLVRVSDWKSWVAAGDLRGNPAENKRRFLEMARRGEKPPHKRTSDGRKLRSYIYPSKAGFDASFRNQLKQVNESWVEFKRNPDLKKLQLMRMAKSGSERPPLNSPLGRVMKLYTQRGGRNYDASFDAEIRKVRPDWFKPNDGRALLLEMAKRGDPKPLYHSRLGGLLRTCRDKAFLDQLRNLNPSWFKTQYDRCADAKRELLELAIGCADMPLRESRFYHRLHEWTSKSSSSYDPTFTSKLKRARPDWFKYRRINK